LHLSTQCRNSLDKLCSLKCSYFCSSFNYRIINLSKYKDILLSGFRTEFLLRLKKKAKAIKEEISLLESTDNSQNYIPCIQQYFQANQQNIEELYSQYCLVFSDDFRYDAEEEFKKHKYTIIKKYPYFFQNRGKTEYEAQRAFENALLTYYNKSSPYVIIAEDRKNTQINNMSIKQVDIEAFINSLKPYKSIKESIPTKGNKQIYVPIEGKYDRKFFVRLFLLRKYYVEKMMISKFDYYQYQVSVNIEDLELILLVFGSHLFTPLEYPKSNGHAIGIDIRDQTENALFEQYPILKIIYDSSEYSNLILDWIKRNFEEASQDYKNSRYGIRKWMSEYKLYWSIKPFFIDAIYQYRSDWLGSQSLDVFIPSIKLGIEYQGKQHYSALDYFGGEEKLTENIKRDKDKESKCNENNVNLIKWPYTRNITPIDVINYFNYSAKDVFFQLTNIKPFPVLEVLSTGLIAETSKQIKEEKEPEKIIRQYSMDGTFIKEFNTISEAALEIGVNANSIRKAVCHQRKSSANFIWIKEKKSVAPTNIDPTPFLTEKTNHYYGNSPKAVVQINREGEIMQRYFSIGDASRITGISKDSIRDAAKGKQKSAGGFFWMFEEP